MEKKEGVNLLREPYQLWVEDETTARCATRLRRVPALRGSKPVVKVRIGRYKERWNVFISWNAATKQTVVTLATRLDAAATALHLQQVRRANNSSGCAGLNVLWDKCGAHHGKTVVQCAWEQGINLWYLPPHSPDLNPVEEINRQLKVYLSNWLFWSVEELEEAIISFFEQRGYHFNLHVENYILPHATRGKNWSNSTAKNF